MKEDSFKSKLRESMSICYLAIFSKFMSEDPILEDYDNVGLLIRIPSGLHIITIDKGLKVRIL